MNGSEQLHPAVDYLVQCVTGPNLFASILIILCLIYWFMVMIGSLDLEFFDFDLDLDMDGEGDSLLSAGLVGLKILNVGNVPMMVWVSVFAVAFWATSMLLWFARDGVLYQLSWWYDLQYVLRNGAIALVVTKLATQPMIPWFAHRETFTADDLIGTECEVSTSEVTDKFGQARYQTDAAPLLLDVRTVGESLAKGDRATIVDYDPETKTYLISPIKQKQEV